MRLGQELTSQVMGVFCERVGSVELFCDYWILYASVVRLPKLHPAYTLSQIFDFIRDDACEQTDFFPSRRSA